MKNKQIGSTLQSLFDELGEGEEFRLLAQKKAFVIAAEQRMAALKMSKNALSKRMGTSRPAIDRLLDPNNTSLTFASLNRATRALGLDFSLAFFEAKPRIAAEQRMAALKIRHRERASGSHLGVRSEKVARSPRGPHRTARQRRTRERHRESHRTSPLTSCVRVPF